MTLPLGVPKTHNIPVWWSTAGPPVRLQDILAYLDVDGDRIDINDWLFAMSTPSEMSQCPPISTFNRWWVAWDTPMVMGRRFYLATTSMDVYCHMREFIGDNEINVLPPGCNPDHHYQTSVVLTYCPLTDILYELSSTALSVTQLQSDLSNLQDQVTRLQDQVTGLQQHRHELPLQSAPQTPSPGL